MKLRNFKAIISYDGRAYYGFQKQKEKASVQGELERALSFLFGYEVIVKGAGRTDAGVSAKGQVISFKLKDENLRDLENKRAALNRLLPMDIFCSKLEEAPLTFDARHSSSGKRYSYSFCYLERDPLNAFETALKVSSFDISLFKEAISLFAGKHNFQNFTTKKEDKDNFIRILEPIVVLENGPHVKAIFSSNGFMTYMIRLMVGSAFKVATHSLSIEALKASLDNKERKILSFKASPKGLILEEVYYGKTFRK